MGIQFKTNQVKCDIGSYLHYWRGVMKSGKTTLFYNLVKEQYGDLNKGLLISLGNELGYKALDGLVYAEAPTWGDMVEIIDSLVEEKEHNEFEIVALDTVDEMVKLGMQEVRRLHKKLKGTSVEFNACFGGYAQPRHKLTELIDEQISRLERAGYGIVFIGHTKIKDIKEKNGDEYQQLTSNLNSDYDGIFANKADIVMTIVVEKEINENKHIAGTERYMYFRSDGFVDAGGRFTNVPEKIEYSAENYIKAFEEAVKGNIVGKITDKEIEKRKKVEVEERKKAALEYADEEKNNAVDLERNEELKNLISEKYGDLNAAQKKEFKKLMEKNGVSSLKDVSEIPTENLQSLVDFF